MIKFSHFLLFLVRGPRIVQITPVTDTNDLDYSDKFTWNVSFDEEVCMQYSCTSLLTIHLISFVDLQAFNFQIHLHSKCKWKNC